MDSFSPEARARVADSFANQSIMHTFGAQIVQIGPGAVTISAPIAPHLLQQQGFGHAALTFGLGDSAAGYAALSLTPLDREVVTTEMKVNLLAPARGARLIARGRVVKPGRRLMVVTAEVFAEAEGVETQVALLTGSMMPVDL